MTLGVISRCKPCVVDYQREARLKRPRIYRSIELKKRYGITLVEYEKMLAFQGGTCALCPRGPEESNRGVLTVDHDHACCPQKAKSCGKCIRALLCSYCNSGLGNFKDDPDLMRRAAEYVSTRAIRPLP